MLLVHFLRKLKLRWTEASKADWTSDRGEEGEGGGGLLTCMTELAVRLCDITRGLSGRIEL